MIIEFLLIGTVPTALSLERSDHPGAIRPVHEPTAPARNNSTVSSRKEGTGYCSSGLALRECRRQPTI